MSGSTQEATTERRPSNALAAGAATGGAGAALLATAAAACCAGPGLSVLIVTLLGAGGAAWAAGLKPYAPWMLAAAALLIAVGFRATRRAPGCEPPAGSRLRRRRLFARGVVWGAAALWLASFLIQLQACLGGGSR